MDNASKALLIIGAVLIGVLIISFGIYQYSRLEEISSEYSDKTSREQIMEFNSNFTIYQSRNLNLGESVTAHDIVTVVNFARDYNLKHEYSVKSERHIVVNVIGLPGGNYYKFELKSDDEQIEFITKYSINSVTKRTINFECTDKDISYGKDGKVNSITFRYIG